MIPKFRCDGCNEDFKVIMKDKVVYVLDDGLDGVGVMCHNNLKDKIIFCDDCFQEFEEKLKEDRDWLSLQQMEEVEDFVKFQELKDFLNAK